MQTGGAAAARRRAHDVAIYTVNSTVAADRQTAFLEAMHQLRRFRLRTGGTRWELYRDRERHNNLGRPQARIRPH